VYGAYKIHLQNFTIYILIHNPFYEMKVANSLPTHTSSNHNNSASKFDRRLHMLVH
jgi:hypothetical protein